jgi:predicted alpha/beta-fold hydrolase
MEIGSRGATNTNEEFIALPAMATLQILSFYETIPTKHVGIVVERHSAFLGLPNETLIGLQATQSTLCKFPDRNNSNYGYVRHSLRRIIDIVSRKRTENAPEAVSVIEKKNDPRQGWIPNTVSKVGKTAMGLLEIAGSMEEPHDFSQAEVDVVAIHGLGGSPSRSWINNEASTLWLRDFLQADFPTARVMSYGYKTDTALLTHPEGLSQLANDLLDNLLASRLDMASQRPIIFIAYSFGGLILKKVHYPYLKFGLRSKFSRPFCS